MNKSVIFHLSTEFGLKFPVSASVLSITKMWVFGGCFWVLNRKAVREAG